MKRVVITGLGALTPLGNTITEFWQNVGEKVATLLATPGSKSGTWVYLKRELEKKRKKKTF